MFLGGISIFTDIKKKKRTEVATSESTKADGPGFAGAQPWLHDAVPPCHLKTLQLRSRDHAVGEPRFAEIFVHDFFPILEKLSESW